MNRTEAFRALHRTALPLLLPNAWDVAEIVRPVDAIRTGGVFAPEGRVRV